MASVKGIFTRTGKELRKEFMGKAMCRLQLRSVENLPLTLASFFAQYSGPDLFGVSKIALPGTVGVGISSVWFLFFFSECDSVFISAPEDGEPTPGHFIFNETIEFEAPLQVSKQGELLPISVDIALYGRDVKDRTLTREVGTVPISFPSHRQLIF